MKKFIVSLFMFGAAIDLSLPIIGYETTTWSDVVAMAAVNHYDSNDTVLEADDNFVIWVRDDEGKVTDDYHIRRPRYVSWQVNGYCDTNVYAEHWVGDELVDSYEGPIEGYEWN